ncbi:hypothetical protein ACP4OV_031662 [Aristida adscensionis]
MDSANAAVVAMDSADAGLLAMDSVDAALVAAMDSANEALLAMDSIITKPDFEMVQDSLAPDSESIECVADSESFQLVPESESVEVMPAAKSGELELSEFLCGRCGVIHENRALWNRVHSRFRPCSRCGVINKDNLIAAELRGPQEWDCKPECDAKAPLSSC